MSNTDLKSDVLAAWLYLVSGLTVSMAVAVKAWHRDLLSVVLGGAVAIVLLLCAVLGFWCEGYKQCERERAAASGETTP